MKLIPSYQEFVDDMSLNGKISPELAESLAADFEEIESLNEGFLDSIKNTLSKTFLGSLSSVNMIDKAREMILKDQKDLLSKKYTHEDEIDSLKASLKQAQEAKDTANVDKIGKTISNKENEYKTYVNMLRKRIEKTEDLASKIIKGNNRRSEYYDAGKSQDELIIVEFEYKLAKERAKSDPKEIKALEIKVKTAKEEAAEAQEELKKSAENQEKVAKEEKENKKSELSTDIDEIESAIEEYEKQIEELKIKKIKSKNKKLNPADQDRLESRVASLKKMQDKKKHIEKAMKGSRNKSGKIHANIKDFNKGQKAKELEKETKATEKSAEDMAKNVAKVNAE
jgi:hypothetical protein